MRISDEQFKHNPKNDESDPAERNDCTVITFAYAFNTSYEFAHKWMEEAGRKPRKGVSMYRALYSDKQVARIREELGYDLIEIEYRWNEQYRRKPTLRKLLNEIGEGMHIVIVSGHTFAIDDFKVVDTWKNSPHVRAQRVFKVVKL